MKSKQPPPIEHVLARPELYQPLLGCCCRFPVMKSAKAVAYVSVASLVVNLLLLIMVGNRTPINMFVEVIILLVEFVCCLLLLYGLKHSAAKCMRPYLVFGLVWNMCLIVLWLFCFIEFLQSREFTTRVVFSTSEFINGRIEWSRTARTWFSALTVFGLAFSIGFYFWCLHVVLLVSLDTQSFFLLAYFFLKYQKDGSSEVKRALISKDGNALPSKSVPV
ncbi:hypothetical protein AAVH_12688 [Aphelenchoides avenae]|nr:hypothetical protein AAVH_12688 [Aphelenchus avenae]